MIASYRLPQAILDLELPVLPTDRRPSHHDILDLQNVIFGALKLIPGAGSFGHAHLVCRDGTEDWRSRTNNAPAERPPVDPGPIAIIPNGTLAFEERQLVRLHESNTKTYDVGQQAQAWLLLKLPVACHIYVEALKHTITGFTHLRPSRFFAHLYAIYGRMTDVLLAQNLENLKLPYDPMQQQIEQFFSRQERTQLIAANDDPISERTLIRISKEVIRDCGHFNPALDRWEARIEAHKSWTHFKTNIFH